MNSNKIIEHLQNNDLPVRIVGTGNVTHVIVGKLFDGKNDSDVICLFAQPMAQASAEFIKILKSEGCRCGKQKLSNYPLCGLCFSNLKKGLQTSLRQNKGVELEVTYDMAVLYLTGKKR
jgi:hypothetical protein